MTDDEYIEKLYKKGFDIGQVNQLLKIYTYTKDLEIDLSDIDSSVEVDELRGLVNRIKNSTDGTIQFINNISSALKEGIYVNDLIGDKYSEKHAMAIMNLRRSGFDTSIIERTDLSDEQINILYIGMSNGKRMDFIANPKLSREVMIALTMDKSYNRDKIAKISDLEKYDISQINVLMDMSKKSKVDLNVIANPEFNAERMRIIAECMEADVDYTSFIYSELPEKNLDVIFRAMNLGIEDKYLDLLKNEKLTEAQLDEILKIIESAIEKEIPIKNLEEIFDDRNDFGAMDILFKYLISDNCDKKFFNELLEIHNFDKINELIIAKETLNKDEFNIVKNIEDTKYMHVISSLLRDENEKCDIDKYLKCKTVEELLKMFVDKNKENDIEAEKTDEKPREVKYEVDVLYNEDQFFKLDNGNILQVYCEDDIDWDWLQDGMFGESYEGSEISQEYLEEFFEDKTERIKKIIDTFLYIGYTEKDGCETIAAIDLLTNKEIEDGMEEYTTLIEDNAFDHDNFIDDYTDNAIEYMSSEYADRYTTFFEDATELKSHGGPNIDNEILFDVARDMSSSWAFIVTKKDIEKEYGKFDEESISKAKRLFKAQMDEQDEVLDGHVYGYVVYDSNGEEVDRSTMFIGEYAIDDMIGCIDSKIDYEIGNFSDIEDCLESLNGDKEEER